MTSHQLLWDYITSTFLRITPHHINSYRITSHHLDSHPFTSTLYRVTSHYFNLYRTTSRQPYTGSHHTTSKDSTLCNIILVFINTTLLAKNISISILRLLERSFYSLNVTNPSRPFRERYPYTWRTMSTSQPYWHGAQ